MTSVIFNVSEIPKVDFSKVTQTLESLQYSVNKQLTHVGWESSTEPEFVSTLETAQGLYDPTSLRFETSNHFWLVMV